MDSSVRKQRLNSLFQAVLKGTRKLHTTKDSHLFLEAILVQESSATALEEIVASHKGVESLRECLVKDFSAGGLAMPLQTMAFFSSPEVGALDHSLLRHVIKSILTPPTFWNAAKREFTAGSMSLESRYHFACFIKEVLVCPNINGINLDEDAKHIINSSFFCNCPDFKSREIIYKIKNLLIMRLYSPEKSLQSQASPGGRHDNDFKNIKDISIYPTNDELLSRDIPFYLTRDEVFETEESFRAAVHRDNQFRLVREDMLDKIRQSLQQDTGNTGKPHKKGMELSGLWLNGFAWGKFNCYNGTCMKLTCSSGLEKLNSLETKAAKTKFLNECTDYLRFGSCGVLKHNEDICCFVLLERDIQALVEDPSCVVIGFPDSRSFGKALEAITSYDARSLKLVFADIPVFAYEPILKSLQEMSAIPLQEILFRTGSRNAQENEVENVELNILQSQSRLRNAQVLNETVSYEEDCVEYNLDPSQRDAIALGLSNKVCVIQGPPGTGKSYTGSLFVRKMVDAGMKVLFITYTNHALDQFIQDIVNAGVRKDDITRLGSKTADVNEEMALKNRAPKRIPAKHLHLVKVTQNCRDDYVNKIKEWYMKREKANYFELLMEYLEFYEESVPFFEAFQVKTASLDPNEVASLATLTLDEEPGCFDGKAMDNELASDSPVENKNSTETAKEDAARDWDVARGSQKATSAHYLLKRWCSGKSAGHLKKTHVTEETECVWSIPADERERLVDSWMSAIFKEENEQVMSWDTEFRCLQQDSRQHLNRRYDPVFQDTKVIACTTNGASRYDDLINKVSPQAVVVEEAGEILESHILASLSSSVKQLVLIGDHKQLRPKVNNYSLTVEKNDGFDLNMSLFERLILHGHPHFTLTKQHRMHPDISKFPRLLTYPDLQDGPSTSNRHQIPSLQSRVIFINHQHPETQPTPNSNTEHAQGFFSKENLFEAQMVVGIVRYLTQQGFASRDMVVLTPYLGQLRVIQLALKELYNAVLTDGDVTDFLNVGLSPVLNSNSHKAKIRISTVDNYQGEESKIVIASMTRSNSDGDIGFMASPERLNVLITRARDALIMLGNKETFMKSRTGQSTWPPFFKILQEHGHLYEGLPIQCPRHPDYKAFVKEPSEFSTFAKDGGCIKKCNCNAPVDRVCEQGHMYQVACCERYDDDLSDSRCGECRKLDRERMHNLVSEAENQDKIEAVALQADPGSPSPEASKPGQHRIEDYSKLRQKLLDKRSKFW
ncbi:NFX1-type zinc finger-containing protein 1 [Ceratocystis lukuohia]|uniref:NFX1-type zinc finger-containing protein 1 n=1 Tax=Ceratocystis lukuohia TaxID=2019550 RepID=A0ABR4MCY1_9PEZI